MAIENVLPKKGLTPLLDFRVFVQTLDAVTKPERGLVLVSLRQGTVVREDRGSNSGHDDPLAVF